MTNASIPTCHFQIGLLHIGCDPTGQSGVWNVLEKYTNPIDYLCFSLVVPYDRGGVGVCWRRQTQYECVLIFVA